MIVVAHKRTSKKTLEKKYGKCIIADVTSKAPGDLRMLSPFYPHGNIPIPNSSQTAESVEGLWQGLKVFEEFGIDLASFENRTGRNIKRTVRRFGIPKGHQYGLDSNELLAYVDARLKIYLPAFKFVLEKYCIDLIKRLRKASKENTVVLLDYTTNGNVFDTSIPLSHAQLIKAYANEDYDNLSTQKKIQQNIRVTSKAPSSLPQEKIMQLLENNPMSSKGIIGSLDLDISSRRLTSILKKITEVSVIDDKPLKFKTSDHNLRLFK